MDKAEIINAIIAREGGYVDDPADSGGETNWGITEKAARAAGYSGPMSVMPKPVAFAIYAERYWDSVRADELQALDADIAHEVVDTAVNMGPARAGKFLQRALNALNQGGKLYPDIAVDGMVGKATIAALSTYLQGRSSGVMLKALNCLQGAAYIELAERREKDERFLYGWLRTRVNL